MQQARSSSSRLAFGCLVFAAAILGAGAPALAWERAHSVGSNTGYADVDTTAVTKAPITVPNLGTFAPGAGPVTAPDGTVYLGNQQGKLIALHADGSAFWSRDLPSGYAITASPLVGPNGYVYVIGTREYTDHRVNPAMHVVQSMLNVFTPGGGWVGPREFPDHDGPGAAYAPLNLWRSGGDDVLMVPAIYQNHVTGGHETRLIAFSTGGQVLADQKVSTFVQTVTGGAECFFVFCGFEHGQFNLPQAAPGVGIFTFAGGGTPFIMVSDQRQDLVGYTFTGNAFIERFRLHDDKHYMRSTPTVHPDGHTIVGTERIGGDDYEGEVIFAGPNAAAVPPVNLGLVYGPPTIMRDGRVALVSGGGRLAILQDGHIATSIDIAPASIASAAASRTHLFVSTYDAFLSYDADSLAEVGRISWVGGGSSPPAIGSNGTVYAIASNILFVFPPGGRPLAPKPRVPGQDLVAVDPTQPTTQPQPQQPTQPASQLYHPPLTSSGNRLFACMELDQDDCGKGDYKDIALAWCQKQGYAKAKGYDVDSRKVKAETLDGRYCSKNKCKVFDSIRCEM